MFLFTFCSEEYTRSTVIFKNHRCFKLTKKKPAYPVVLMTRRGRRKGLKRRWPSRTVVGRVRMMIAGMGNTRMWCRMWMRRRWPLIYVRIVLIHNLGAAHNRARPRRATRQQRAITGNFTGTLIFLIFFVVLVGFFFPLFATVCQLKLLLLMMMITLLLIILRLMTSARISAV